MRSIASSSDPRRSPDSVRISSRLPRVAWSIAIVAPALSRNGGERGGRFADLRALDIGHAGCRRRQLEPAERAEGFAGGNRKERCQPPLGGRAVEDIARKRRDRGQRAPIGRKIGFAVQRIGYDDLAGLEPRDLGGQRSPVAFGDAEFAGRNIDPGQREARLFAGGREPRACDRKQIVVAPRVEQRVFGERAGA